MTATAPRHRPSSATAILDTARAILDDGGSISLDTAARAAGLTKPGLMYHFPTKAALLDALVDHIVDTVEADLSRHLCTPLEQAAAQTRLRAYVHWALTTDHHRSDLVMLSDPKLADRMMARWRARLHPWVQIPAATAPAQRARMTTARLIADGAWLADCTATFPIPAEDRPTVLAIALDLLGEENS